MVPFNRRLLLGISSAALLFSAPLSGHAMIAPAIQPAVSQVQSDSASDGKTFDPIVFVKRVFYPTKPPAKPKK